MRMSFMTFRLVTELNKNSGPKFCVGPEADEVFKTFRVDYRIIEAI